MSKDKKVSEFIINTLTQEQYQELANNGQLSDTELYITDDKDGGGSGLEICDIGMALYIDESKGLRRYLNGQTVDINSNTQKFLDRLLQIKTTNPDWFTTEENWQSEATLSVDGCVDKFVLNYSGDGETIVSVKLPKYPDYVDVMADDISVSVYGSGVGTAFVNQTANDAFIMGIQTGNGGDGIYCSGVKSTALGSTGSTSGVGKRIIGLATKAQLDTAGVTDNGIKASVNNENRTKLKLRYFIQIATGAETENNIVNDIELNNPFSFGDSKYSPIELNNISWLKSSGQWNSKALYPDFYDWVLGNVNKSQKGFLGQTMYMWGSSSGGYMTTSTTPVVGSAIYDYVSKKEVGYVTALNSTTGEISFKDEVNNVSYTDIGRYPTSDESSAQYITDYDFVINTADEIFRLPLLDGSEQNINYLAKTTITTPFTAPCNGWVSAITATLKKSNAYLLINGVKVGGAWAGDIAKDGISVCAKVNKGDIISFTNMDTTDTHFAPIFCPSIGNGSLYYYVGETVQNANLIDAGRMSEAIANLIPNNSELVAKYCTPDYSAGVSITQETNYKAEYPCWIYLEVTAATNTGGSHVSKSIVIDGKEISKLTVHSYCTNAIMVLCPKGATYQITNLHTGSGSYQAKVYPIIRR